MAGAARAMRLVLVAFLNLFALQWHATALPFPNEAEASLLTMVSPTFVALSTSMYASSLSNSWKDEGPAASVQEEQDDLPYHYYAPEGKCVENVTTASPHSPFHDLTNLIMVPCHAIYIGHNSTLRSSFNLSSNFCIQGISSHSAFSAHLIDSWILEEYQVPQLHHFITHLKTALQLLADDPHAVLILSGGPTRAAAGCISEAASYLAYAMEQQWFGHPYSVWSRVITEDYAKDSYENLLYSLCRFKEYTGYYPFNTTVIGFPFKTWRFQHLHRASLRYPISRFHYPLVVSYPNGTEPANGADKGWENDPLDISKDSAIKLFEESALVCLPTLQRKKLSRNPFRRYHSYKEICPDLKRFFQCETDS